jgi:pyrroline-5-carboxylate reductase
VVVYNGMKKVAFLGTGRIATALITSFIKKGIYKRSQIIATHHRANRAQDLAKLLSITVVTDNVEAVLASQIIYLCVRPLQVPRLVQEIAPAISKKHIVVSVAVGVPLSWLRKKLPLCNLIIHFHPPSVIFSNVPGISFIAYEKYPAKGSVNHVKAILSKLGETIIVPEKMMDKYAVFSGCSPAFFSRIAKIWQRIAMKSGIPQKHARKIIYSTFSGIGSSIDSQSLDLETLERLIATPGGVTKAGIKRLTQGDLSNILTATVKTCFNKIERVRSTFIG